MTQFSPCSPVGVADIVVEPVIKVPPNNAWQVWSAARWNAAQDGVQADDLVAGAHWIAPAAGNQPVFTQNVTNNLPSWLFDGDASSTDGSMFVRDGLNLNTGNGFEGDCTGLFVIRPTSLSSTRYIQGGVGATPTATTKTRIFTVAGGDIRTWNGNSNHSFGYSLAINTTYVVALRWDSSGCRLYVNGAQVGTASTTHVVYKGAVFGSGTVKLGRDHSATGAGFAGHLHEVGFILGQSVDPISDMQWLMNVYGIT